MKIVMVRFHMPGNAKMLQAIGAVALRHSQLDYILQLTIKTLEKSFADIDTTTSLENSDKLRTFDRREKISKLAAANISKAAVAKLDELLQRCGKVSDDRHALMHHIWARHSDGKLQTRGRKHKWRPLPTVREVKALADEIVKLTGELDQGRRCGFLAAAIEETLAAKKAR